MIIIWVHCFFSFWRINLELYFFSMIHILKLFSFSMCHVFIIYFYWLDLRNSDFMLQDFPFLSFPWSMYDSMSWNCMRLLKLTTQIVNTDIISITWVGVSTHIWKCASSKEWKLQIHWWENIYVLTVWFELWFSLFFWNCDVFNFIQQICLTDHCSISLQIKRTEKHL